MIAVLIIYFGALAFIFAYSMSQLNLVYHYVKSNRSNHDNSVLEFDAANVPFVTVQLPVYNEMYVVNRLLDAVGNFDYPLDKFEIQVLDDSTDETVQIVDKKVKELLAKGINAYHVRREIRKGYKAGALAKGMDTSKGEFIAIFDADFVPSSNFFKEHHPVFCECENRCCSNEMAAYQQKVLFVN